MAAKLFAHTFALRGRKNKKRLAGIEANRSPPFLFSRPPFFFLPPTPPTLRKQTKARELRVWPR